MRVQFDEMKRIFKEVLIKKGAPETSAEIVAQIMTETSRDGVYSHGVNRFPRMIYYIDEGYIDVNAMPECVASFGAFERWKGNLGFGVVNAKICMDRAIELAKSNGIGCVALGNTNHWMRGGTYGIQAVNAGCAALCWTISQPNMPAWGAKDRRIGNNPIVLAVPGATPTLIADSAMAQFSYGAMEKYKLAGERLPFAGGYDSHGKLTDDPAEIEKTWRVLPIGFWKGAAISILLDMFATSAAKGKSVHQVGELGDEYDVCQVFIVLDVLRTSGKEWVEEMVASFVKDLKGSERVDPEKEVLYPGERSNATREINAKEGIPVNESVWDSITAVLK